MSDKIKPSEVSEVLQQQLQEVNGAQQFDEVGTVLTVGDGVARIYGLRNAEAPSLADDRSHQEPYDPEASRKRQ